MQVGGGRCEWLGQRGVSLCLGVVGVKLGEWSRIVSMSSKAEPGAGLGDRGERGLEALAVRNAPRWLARLGAFGHLEARPDGAMAVNRAPAWRTSRRQPAAGPRTGAAHTRVVVRRTRRGSCRPQPIARGGRTLSAQSPRRQTFHGKSHFDHALISPQGGHAPPAAGRCHRPRRFPAKRDNRNQSTSILYGSTPPAMGNCRHFLTRQRSGMLPRLKAPKGPYGSQQRKSRRRCGREQCEECQPRPLPRQERLRSGRGPVARWRGATGATQPLPRFP